jgi:hypothetical protein
MKKKSRIEMAKEIISSVKREMEKPRMTESVRNGLSLQTAHPLSRSAARAVSKERILMTNLLNASLPESQQPG